MHALASSVAGCFRDPFAASASSSFFDVGDHEARLSTATSPPADERSPIQTDLIVVASVVRVKHRFSVANRLLRTLVVALPPAKPTPG
jgi:hypothetical protein